MSMAAAICRRSLQMVICKVTQSSLVTLTFDLLTLEVTRNVTRGTDKLPANFGAYANFLCQVLGKHASN